MLKALHTNAKALSNKAKAEAKKFGLKNKTKAHGDSVTIGIAFMMAASIHLADFVSVLAYYRMVTALTPILTPNTNLIPNPNPIPKP